MSARGPMSRWCVLLLLSAALTSTSCGPVVRLGKEVVKQSDQVLDDIGRRAAQQAEKRAASESDTAKSALPYTNSPSEDIFDHVPVQIGGETASRALASLSEDEKNLRSAVPALFDCAGRVGLSRSDLKLVMKDWSSHRREAWRRFPPLNRPSLEAFEEEFTKIARLNQLNQAAPILQVSRRVQFEKAWIKAVKTTNPDRFVRKSKILDAIPDKTTFAAVFERDPSTADLGHLRTAEESLAKLDRQRPDRGTLGKDSFLTRLSQFSDGDVAVVLGHSVEEGSGRSLVLPTGETVSFADIHRTAREANTNCLILSCFSRDINLASEISMTEAIQLAGTIRAATEAKALTVLGSISEGFDIADLATKVSSELTTSRYRKKGVTFAVGGVSVGAIGYGANANRE
jgi:hypothetical protein